MTGSQLVFLVPADAAPHAPSLAQPAPEVTEAGLPAPHREAVASGVAACRAAAFFCFSLFSFSRRLASSSCISRKDLPAATPGDQITQIEQCNTVMGDWCGDLTNRYNIIVVRWQAKAEKTWFTSRHQI